MKNKKLILTPAAAAERICPLRPEDRLLCAVGQFEPRRMNICIGIEYPAWQRSLHSSLRAGKPSTWRRKAACEPVQIL